MRDALAAAGRLNQSQDQVAVRPLTQTPHPTSPCEEEGRGEGLSFDNDPDSSPESIKMIGEP
jgi:hypothetical protein